MGARQSFGLFISPIHSSTGMGIATTSLALAIGQLTWAPSSRLLALWQTAIGPGWSCKLPC